jgi:hypothetical protein
MTATEWQTGEAEEQSSAREAERRVELEAIHIGWAEAEDFGKRPRVIIDAHVMRIIKLETTLLEYAAIEGAVGEAARVALKDMHPLTPEFL